MKAFTTLQVCCATVLTLISLSVSAQSVDSVCFNTAPAAFISNAPASGGDNSFTYEWQDSTAAGTWNAAPGTNNGLIYQPGNLTETTYYRRQVTSTACGLAISNTLAVVVFDELDSTSTSVTNVSCNSGSDGAISVSVTGGLMPYTYTWSSGGSTTGTNSGLSAGTYTVSVSDSKLCDTLIYTFSVTEPALLVSATVVDSNVSCNAGSDGGATASSTGGTMPYTYTWSNAATTASITGVTAGTYSVTVTDQNGCTDSSSVTITDPALLVSATVVDSNVTCNGFANGGATAAATGGTAAYTYAWSNSATTASITGVIAGTYSVTITDQNGCTDSSSVTITEPTQLVSASIVDSNISCNSGSDGGATASSTGGTLPYTYAWSNSATTASITGVVAGTYSVTVTDQNGCTDSSSVTITEPALLVSASVVDSNISCNAGADGGATASSTGGTMPYTYAWSNAATTASITGVIAGTYSVTVTDQNGCTDSSSVTITEPALLVSASVVDSNISCNAGADGGATASSTGGTMPYTYAWSNAATTASITGVVAGTYSVTVTDQNGCTDSSSVTITEPVVLIASSVLDSNVSCNGELDGGATSAAAGGTMPYTYAWSNAATTASITGVAAGTYSVTITDQNGCTDSASVTITEPVVLIASSVVDSNVTCNGLPNGGATAASTGGTTPYTFAWSNAATTASITGVMAGTYTVTITDANGCTDSSSVTISEPVTLVAATVLDSNISCNGAFDGGATASATGGTMNYTYAWSNAATTASITGVAAGTYSVTITDANGCTDSASVTITEPAVLVSASVVDSNISCNAGADGGATASSTGGTMPYTYAWSNAATTASITGVVAGTYSVTVTDQNGCTDSSSVTITEPAVLIASSVLDSNVSCNGELDGGATSAATGGTMPYTYAWSNAATTASITGVAAGTYSVTITDQNGCTDSASVTITEPVVLIASSVVDSNVTCNGLPNGGATAASTGGTTPYTFAWSNAATTASITGVMAGTYTVTITDANGCTDSSSVTISEPVTLVAATVLDSTISCNGAFDGGATASATGGTMNYTYAWSNAATTASITGVAAGTYSVTITDANGCTDSASVTVTEPAVLVSAAVVDSTISCNSLLDGGATASSTGGTMPYTYAWSNAATTASITGVAAGTYAVTVTDQNGCTDSSSVTITEPAALIASSIVDSNASCNSFTNGGATASASGGTSPYTYAWSNSASTATITGVGAGTYTVTISDANGCTETSSVTITEPALLASSVTIDSNVSCFGLADGGATVNVAGGTANYSYLWSNSAITNTINSLAADTFYVTVTDANGCVVTDSVIIDQPDSLTLSTTATDVTCNSGSDGSVALTVTGGTTNYAFLWSNSAVSQNINSVIAGTYTVTVTDANGCVKSASDTVNQPAVLNGGSISTGN